MEFEDDYTGRTRFTCCIYDITKLPFEAKEKTYMTIGEELAEIIYTGEDNRLIYRMSVGEDDNSGDYTVYENITEIKVSGLTVTLKGKKGLVNLAIWSDGKYAYSLSVDEAVKDEEMTAIIYEIISK